MTQFLNLNNIKSADNLLLYKCGGVSWLYISTGWSGIYGGESTYERSLKQARQVCLPDSCKFERKSLPLFCSEDFSCL